MAGVPVVVAAVLWQGGAAVAGAHDPPPAPEAGHSRSGTLFDERRTPPERESEPAPDDLPPHHRGQAPRPSSPGFPREHTGPRSQGGKRDAEPTAPAPHGHREPSPSAPSARASTGTGDVPVPPGASDSARPPRTDDEEQGQEGKAETEQADPSETRDGGGADKRDALGEAADPDAARSTGSRFSPLPFGAGLVLIGLGIGFLALRLRRD